jgi:hypothetical protein
MSALPPEADILAVPLKCLLRAGIFWVCYKNGRLVVF